MGVFYFVAGTVETLLELLFSSVVSMLLVVSLQQLSFFVLFLY